AEEPRTNHLPIIPIKQAVVVDVHSLREIRLLLALHFYVNEHPFFLTSTPPDLDQLVDHAPAQFRIAQHLLELLVQGFITATPIDLGMRVGKEEADECLEVAVQSFLPGTVKIAHGSPFALVREYTRCRGSRPFPDG